MQTGLSTKCDPAVSASTCFLTAGIVHGLTELGPGFLTYCASAPADTVGFNRWTDELTSDHEAFLRLAVEPSFNELGESGELTLESAQSAKTNTVLLARVLRTTTQSLCRTVRQPK